MRYCDTNYDHLKESDKVDVMECVRCGATAVVEGSLMDTGGGGGLAFLFKDISKLKSIFGAGSRKVNAYACLHSNSLLSSPKRTVSGIRSSMAPNPTSSTASHNRSQTGTEVADEVSRRSIVIQKIPAILLTLGLKTIEQPDKAKE